MTFDEYFSLPLSLNNLSAIWARFYLPFLFLFYGCTIINFCHWIERELQKFTSPQIEIIIIDNEKTKPLKGCSDLGLNFGYPTYSFVSLRTPLIQHHQVLFSTSNRDLPVTKYYCANPLPSFPSDRLRTLQNAV